MAVFPSNATILFTLPVSDLGLVNYVPSVATTPFLVVASFPEALQNNPIVTNVDSDVHTLKLSGRVSSPSVMPNTLKPGSAGACAMWRLQDGFSVPDTFESIAAYNLFLDQNFEYVTQQGTFFLRAVVQSRFRVQSILGDSIEGHLSTEVAWDESL